MPGGSMAVEDEVSRHYTRGSLETTILHAFEAIGRSADALSADDLAPVDEFHIGGHQATLDLTAQLDIRPEMRLLDVGAEIGGPARFLARRFGCKVTGIDLTPEFVAVAEALTRRVGLEGRVSFQVASALALPFENGSFDGATLLHVGMNIAAKRELFAEVARVVKPGGFFAVYDVMRTGEGEIALPVPWAATPATSFVADRETYRSAAQAAGFAVIAERDRREFAIDFFRQMRARVTESGPPPVGLPILMGPDAPIKVANMMANLEQGRIAPVEMICQRL